MWEFIQHQLQTNQFFSAGLVVSVLGGLILALKQLPNQLLLKVKDRFVFTATIYQFDPLYDDFEAWFFKRYKNKYRNVEAVSRAIGDNLSNDDKPPLIGESISPPRNVLYKQIQGLFFIKYKGRLIHIRKGRDKLEHTSDIRALYINQYHLSCIGGSQVIKELLEDCILYNAKKEPDELKIYSHNSYGDWYVSGRITAKDINNIILPDTVKEKILTDISNFNNSKDWYKKASIFYKRGHLYHGSPGNGKTSLSLSLASFMERDLYCLDLNSISENEGLKRLFGTMAGNSFLLVEDIDGFYNLRVPVKKDSKISFSTFLNCIDGAFYKEGIFTVITTNKIELVDPALIRNGRMDLVLEIPQPGIDEINKYLQIFFNDNYAISDYSHNYSMCDIQEICLKHKDNPDLAVKELGSLLNIAS